MKVDLVGFDTMYRTFSFSENRKACEGVLFDFRRKLGGFNRFANFAVGAVRVMMVVRVVVVGLFVIFV